MFRRTTTAEKAEPRSKPTVQPMPVSAGSASGTTSSNKPKQERTTATTPHQTPVTREAVAKLAYQKWQQRGCPDGEDQRDWFEAERELTSLEAAIAKPRSS